MSDDSQSPTERAARAIFALSAPERLWDAASEATKSEYWGKASAALAAAREPPDAVLGTALRNLAWNVDNKLDAGLSAAEVDLLNEAAARLSGDTAPSLSPSMQRFVGEYVSEHPR